MFDTHCHLNFEALENNVDEIIKRAKEAGVNYFLVPGTDVDTSKKAVKIAETFENVYAAVGIHPHHVQEFRIKKEIRKIEKLLLHPKVVAVGEVGIDKHYYQKTKHENYQVNDEFLKLQKEFLKMQIDLAIKYDKSLILHNREAISDLIEVLIEKWDKKLEGRVVFHCCEPDDQLLQFAVKYNVYIGVDGDVTYSLAKQQFIKKVPLKLLVLETDSPFLVPHLQSLHFPNEPKNIKVIAKFIAKLLNCQIDLLIKQTTENAKRLFLVKYRLSQRLTSNLRG